MKTGTDETMFQTKKQVVEVGFVNFAYMTFTARVKMFKFATIIWTMGEILVGNSQLPSQRCHEISLIPSSKKLANSSKYTMIHLARRPNANFTNMVLSDFCH